MRRDTKRRYRAVIFDLGGVVFDSPVKGISRYERELNLPRGFLSKVSCIFESVILQSTEQVCFPFASHESAALSFQKVVSKQ
jgi:hypothetical protein